jgi:2-methylcitrate dehydratase
MTKAEQLAEFAVRARFEDLSEAARETLKVRVLDSIGCAIGAIDAQPIRLVREHVTDFAGAEHCTLIGGGRSAPDRAAFYNGALVRYLDYNDSYLAKGETCHPSDNLAPVLAAAEYADAGGRDLLTALAVAYQVQCRLSDVAPVRAEGFDHTTQGSFAVAAGACRALGLDRAQAVNAIAISGTAFNALRVTRTGKLSHWKGLAYPNTAFGGIHATFLAMRGITGPAEVFEGNKGFEEAISGPFEIDWSKEDLERVTRTIVKRHNAEIHSQSAIAATLNLRQYHRIDARDVKRITVDTFDVAFDIIGGGEEGSKKIVQTKEEADHSLPYIVAAALIDGEVAPRQYLPERIRAADVQELLDRVYVRPSGDFSRAFPAEMPCRVTILLRNGRRYCEEQRDYEGFHTRPMRWQTLLAKLESLSAGRVDADLRREIVEAVQHLEEVPARALARLLSRVEDREARGGRRA